MKIHKLLLHLFLITILVLTSTGSAADLQESEGITIISEVGLADDLTDDSPLNLENSDTLIDSSNDLRKNIPEDPYDNPESEDIELATDFPDITEDADIIWDSDKSSLSPRSIVEDNSEFLSVNENGGNLIITSDYPDLSNSVWEITDTSSGNLEYYSDSSEDGDIVMTPGDPNLPNSMSEIWKITDASSGNLEYYSDSSEDGDIIVTPGYPDLSNSMSEIWEVTDPSSGNLEYYSDSSDDGTIVITPGYPALADDNLFLTDFSDKSGNFQEDASSLSTDSFLYETKLDSVWESEGALLPIPDSVIMEDISDEKQTQMYSPLENLSIMPEYPSHLDANGKLEENTQVTPIKKQIRNTLITTYSRTHEAPSMYFTELISAIIILLTSGALTALYVLRPELTDPESRPGKILAAVREHQGVTITELQRLTGYSRNSVSYNIHRLESYHKISKINRDGTYYYYTGTIPANGNEERMLHIISRKNPHAIFHTIMENPGITQKELIETTGIPQTTCQWHLSCLIRDQAITTQKEKNSIYYTALPEYVWLYNYLTKNSSMSSEDRNDDGNATGADGT